MKRNIGNLTEEEKQIIENVYLDGHGVDAVARESKVPYGTVHKYLKTNNLMRKEN